MPIDRTAKTALDANLVNGQTSDAPKIKANNDVLYNNADALEAAQNAHALAAVLPHADQSVTTAKIKDLAVTTVKIADNAVTPAKIPNASLTFDKFVPSALKNETQNALRLDEHDAQLADIASGVGEIANPTNNSDDTAELQNKINAGAGRKVTLPKSTQTYIVSASLIVPSNTEIDLGGNTIKQKAGTNLENGLFFIPSLTDNVKITNGTIDVNVSQQSYALQKSATGRGIFAYNATNVTIEGVRFRNPYGAMILFAAVTGGCIRKCDFNDTNGTGTDGIALNACKKIRVIANDGIGKDSVTGYGIHVYGVSESITVYRNRMKYYQIVAIGDDYLTGGGESSMVYIDISHNEIIDPSADSSIHFGKHSHFDSNIIINSRDVGISVDYSRNITVNDNVIRQTNASGIAAPGCVDCVIEGNVISNPGSQWKTAVTNGQRCGIWIPRYNGMVGAPEVYPSGNIVVGNTITDQQATKQMYFGISVETNPTNTNVNNIRGNFMSGAVSADYDIPPQTNIGEMQNWKTPTLLNSWLNSDTSTYNAAGYSKDEEGRVHLRGLVQGGTVGSIIFNLPSGYRPPKRQLLKVITNNGSGEVMGRLDVWTNGDVVLSSGGTTWVSLDDLSFRVS